MAAQILIVEDDPLVATDIENRLIALGYGISDVVACGANAVLSIEKSLPDLVLMDIMLGGEIDGIEAAQIISHCFGTPIVFLTAYADEKLLERAKVTGAYGYLRKPFLEMEVRTNIEMALYKSRMERALSDSEERFRLLVEGVRDYGLCMLDPEGFIVSWNLGAQYLHGYEADEIIGRHFSCFSPDSPGETQKFELELAIARTEGRFEEEGWRLRKDGTQFWASIVVTPLRNREGQLRGFAKVTRDITAQKRAQDAIKRSEQLYHTLASNFPNGSVYLLDLEGRFLLAEGQGLATVGLSREQMVGKTVAEVFGDTALSRFLEVTFDRALAGEDVVEETEISGRIRLTHLVPVRDEAGAITCVMAMTQDITAQKQSQLALERSEKLYSTLAQNIPNGTVVLLDRNLRILLAEGRGMGLLGLDKNQIIGKTSDELLSGFSGAEKLNAAYRDALDGKETQLEVKLGEFYRWGHIVPVREGEEIVGAMGLSLDITELKRAEQELLDSEALNRAILDSMLAHIVVLDREGTITAVNEPWRRFAIENSLDEGTWPNYGVGAKYLETCDARLGIGTAATAETAAGIRAVLAGQLPTFQHEYSCHSSSEERWFRMTVTPLATEKGGVVVAHTPITEEKQAERALRVSEERLRAFLDNTPASVFIRDQDGRNLYLNHAAVRFAQKPIEELLGKTFFEGVPEEWAQRMRENSLLVLESGQPHEFEEVIPGPDGFLHHQIVSKFPLVDSQGQLLVAGVAIDITQRKRTEEELRHSQDVLTRAQRTAHLGYVQHDAVSGRTFWSEEIYRILGREPESGDANYEEFLAQVHPDDRVRFPDSLLAPETFDAESAQEYRILRLDGEIRWVHVQGQKTVDDQGRIISYLVTFLDVTDLKRVQSERDQFFELSLDMMVIADMKGHFKRVNPAWTQGLGYTVEELTATPFIEFVHPDDVEATLQESARVNRGDVAARFENRYRCKDGSYKLLQWNSTPDSATGLIYSVATDITNRRQAELEVKDSRNRLSEIINSALDAIITIDDTGCITEFNPAAEQTFGYSRSEVMGRDLAGLLVPSTLRAEHRRGIAHFLRTGEGPVLNRRIECSAMRADGQEFPVELAVTAISVSGQYSFTAFIRDITESKRAEAELRESEERLRFITDNARVGLVMVDAERRYTFANTTYIKILGLPIANIIGQHVFDVLAPLYEAQIRPHLDRAFTGERVTYELHRTSSEGDYYYAVKYEPTGIDGPNPRVVVVITDITERKQSEAELRESEARFRSMADTAPVLIWMSGENKDCSYFNKTWLKFTGRRLDDELGGGWTLGVHPDDLEHCLTSYFRAFVAHEPFEMEYRLQRYDGVYRWILDRGVPRFSPDDRFLGYIGTCVDIDDTKQAHAELARSQQRLASIVASAMDAIITIDESLRILVFNPAAEKMFGFSSADVTGQPINQLIPHRFRDVHSGHVAQFGRTGMTNRQMGGHSVVSGLRSNGEEFPIEASISQIQVDGQKLFTVILRDITEREQAADALRESEERFRQMAENSTEVFWMTDPQTQQTLYVSPAYERIWGRTCQSLYDDAMSFVEAIHPEDRNRVVGVLQTRAVSGEFDVEYRVVRPNGEVRWIWDRSAPIYNADGIVYRVVGTSQDITERKQAEDALKRAHDELEVRVRERTQELAQANDAIQVESNERQMALVALHRAVAELEQARDETEQANTELRANELRLLHGNRIFTELAELRVSVWDELEEAIQAITQAGSEVLDLERCSVWLYNEDETAIRCLYLYQRTPDDYSQGLELLVRDYPRYFRALESREGIVADDAHTHPATSEFSASYLAPLGITSMLDAPLVVGGQMVGVLCFEHVGKPKQWKVEDLTLATSLASLCSLAIESLERTRAEAALRQARDESEQARHEAERANYAKSEFLSRMSHELRTPLNSILGFGQLLKRSPLSDKQVERLDLILNAGRHLLELINEVLDIARVEAGRLHFSIEPVRVTEVLGETIALIQPLAGRSGITIHNDATSQGQFVLADRQRMKQVMLNLLSNAVKYNYDGGHVHIRYTLNQDSHFTISVSNTGRGIASEHLSRLFMPFERLGEEASNIEGTGLGLALSKRLVEAMNGTITVECELGGETTFQVTLPIATDPKEAIALEHSVTVPLSLVKGEKYRVLYIEDNLSNLKLIEGIFTDIAPVRLIAAIQGGMGLELAREHQPNLILLDLHLPDMDGSEVLRRLQADRVTQSIPVVMLSADATPGQIERLLALGAYRYLTKPLDIDSFLSVINETLHAFPRTHGTQ